jgi:hypothetical protein
MEQHFNILQQGSILIDDIPIRNDIRVLVYVELTLQDARIDKHGNRYIVSRQIKFLEINEDGIVFSVNQAPYLDYRCPTENEIASINELNKLPWLNDKIRNIAVEYSVKNLIPIHLKNVREQKNKIIEKKSSAISERLTSIINYWEEQAKQFKRQESLGINTGKKNSSWALHHADEMRSRLNYRNEEIINERYISPTPPVIIGNALIVPISHLNNTFTSSHTMSNNQFYYSKAVEAVSNAEQNLGYNPKKLSVDLYCYSIESSVISQQTSPRFIAVKCVTRGIDSITFSRNEIMLAMNKPLQFIFAIVVFESEHIKFISYVHGYPFKYELSFNTNLINVNLNEVLSKGSSPS